MRQQIILFLVLLFVYYFWFLEAEPTHPNTTDPHMYAAVLVTSESCPHCVTQKKILREEGGPQAAERILILDVMQDKDTIDKIVGEVPAIPLWFNPLTEFKTTGVKSIQELKKMDILLE